jgi:hypothetical protein
MAMSQHDPLLDQLDAATLAAIQTACGGLARGV